MTIQSVPLSSLQSPAANPRTVFDETALEGLAASIKADGLLQNLVVAPAKGKERYRIISGERRFRALKLLADRGDIDGDYGVPVEIRAGLSKDDILRLATIENLQREDLPPLDQAAALAGLIRKGTTLDDLTARTGLSGTTIRRRLALNGLCEDAAQALRDRRITLSQAEALTLGSSEAQLTVLEDIIGSDGDYDADTIRAHFLDDRPTVASAIFPRERYTGTITTDLFQSEETSYFDDAAQFMALQTQAVEDLAATHRETAAWVDVTNKYRIPEWQYDEAEHDQPSGVLINLSPNGTVEVREGLARPEHLDVDTAERTADAVAAPLKPKATYGTPLRRYVAWHKTLAVQEVLLSDRRRAREVLAVHLLTTLRPHTALTALPGEEAMQLPQAALDGQCRVAARSLGLEVDADTAGWTALTPFRPDALSRYEMVKRLSDTDLDALLTLLAVLPFGQDDCDRLDTGESLFNAVAADLQVDMRRHWRPDGAFLNRRNREQLVAIAKDCGFAEGHSGLHSWKKGELVTALLRHFEQARAAAAPNDAQAKALSWLPEAMAFPAVDPDARPGADDALDDGDDALDDDAAHDDGECAA